MTICIAVIFICARFRSPVIFHRLRFRHRLHCLSGERRWLAPCGAPRSNPAAQMKPRATAGLVLCLLIAGVLGRGRGRGARSEERKAAQARAARSIVCTTRCFWRSRCTGTPGTGTAVFLMLVLVPVGRFQRCPPLPATRDTESSPSPRRDVPDPRASGLAFHRRDPPIVPARSGECRRPAAPQRAVPRVCRPARCALRVVCCFPASSMFCMLACTR